MSVQNVRNAYRRPRLSARPAFSYAVKTDGSLTLELRGQQQWAASTPACLQAFYIVVSDFKLVSALRNLV
jgi:hypothetical protein